MVAFHVFVKPEDRKDSSQYYHNQSDLKEVDMTQDNGHVNDSVFLKLRCLLCPCHETRLPTDGTVIAVQSSNHPICFLVAPVLSPTDNGPHILKRNMRLVRYFGHLAGLLSLKKAADVSIGLKGGIIKEAEQKTRY